MKQNSSDTQLMIVAVLSALAVFLGVGAGYLLRAKPTGVLSENGGGVTESGTVVTATVAQDVASIKAGDVFGSTDESAFKDSAQGYLEAGGLNGEGSHALLRAGGASQTVYLTSSVTDLDKFVGMEVKVWGETFQGQSVGWLMDVGRVQVVDLSGTKP